MPSTGALTVNEISREINVLNAVAVVGAGVSIPARLPAVSGLDALLWRALEADQAALRQLQADMNLPPLSAKGTVQRLGGDLDPAWRVVASHARARESFQTTFADLDAERASPFSAAHDAIARLLHAEYVELVVSLNWDSQLEAAWVARYGQEQSIRPRLFKPHGDANSPETPWVLPGQVRVMPAGLTERMADLARERPRVLLVVGYSEADEEVVRQLIAPVEDRWQVVRITRSAGGPTGLAASADQALPELVAALDPASEERPWRYVHFEPQHDFGWALSGRSLGPADVQACPAVPEVAQAVAQLRAASSATIVGESGTGKSLVCAQAAHDRWTVGHEVVELTDASLPGPQLRRTLLDLPRPVVAIVDDAQRLDALTRRDLLACAGNGLSVITAVTEQPAGEDGIRLDAGRATSLLAQHIRRNSESVLPLVHALDSLVGDSPMDEALETRVRQASKEVENRGEPRPWQFTWILTGGWRRVRGDVAALHAQGEQHDLALALVAIGQLVRTGDGIAISDLLPLASACERNGEWLENAIEAACERRLMVRDREMIRLPHTRFARVVLELELERSRASVVQAVASAVDDPANSLAGLHWLLDALFYAGPDAMPKCALLDAAVAAGLTERCWAAPNPDIGSGAAVLDDVRRFQPEAVDVEAHADTLGRWISTAAPPALNGVSTLINSIINRDLKRDDKQLDLICDHIDAERFVGSFMTSTWPEPYFYGKLLDRLGFGPTRFRASVTEALDPDAVRKLFSAWADADDAELFDLAEAVRGVANFDIDLALKICDELAGPIAAAWQEDFADGYHQMMAMLFVLGFGLNFLRRRQPNVREKRVVRHICESLDPDEVARQVSRSTRREWQGVGAGLALIEEASPRHIKKIHRQLDFSLLENSTRPFWENRMEALLDLLVGLAADPDHEPASSWIVEHLSTMQRVSDFAVALAPEAGARRLRELGAELDLSSPAPNWWVSELALAGLVEVDPDLAQSSVAAHLDAFADAFNTVTHLDEAAGVVQVLMRSNPAGLAAIVAAMDAEQARENWGLVLRDEGARARRVVTTLMEVALENGGAMGEVAAALRARYPAASRHSL